MLNIHRSVLALILAGLGATSAWASNVLMTFNDLPSGLSYVNIQYQGFWISPRCHFGIGDPEGNPNARWLSFDGNSCGVANNPGYLGPTGLAACDGCVYIARVDGGRFDLNAFDVVAPPFLVSSSNGGFRGVQPLGLPASETFSGPEWTNLSWIVFEYGGGLAHGLDNLALTVPELPPALLLGAGLTLLLTRRKVRAMAVAPCPDQR